MLGMKACQLSQDGKGISSFVRLSGERTALEIPLTTAVQEEDFLVKFYMNFTTLVIMKYIYILAILILCHNA